MIFKEPTDEQIKIVAEALAKRLAADWDSLCEFVQESLETQYKETCSPDQGWDYFVEDWNDYVGTPLDDG